MRHLILAICTTSIFLLSRSALVSQEPSPKSINGEDLKILHQQVGRSFTNDEHVNFINQNQLKLWSRNTKFIDRGKDSTEESSIDIYNSVTGLQFYFEKIALKDLNRKQLKKESIMFLSIKLPLSPSSTTEGNTQVYSGELYGKLRKDLSIEEVLTWSIEANSDTETTKKDNRTERSVTTRTISFSGVIPENRDIPYSFEFIDKQLTAIFLHKFRSPRTIKPTIIEK